MFYYCYYGVYDETTDFGTHRVFLTFSMLTGCNVVKSAIQPTVLSVRVTPAGTLRERSGD